MVAAAALAVAALVPVVGACGGQTQDGTAAPSDEPAATAQVTAQATKKPMPVSSLPPLVGLGETVRFETPEGGVVQVTAADYADPGAAPAGVAADAGERLVSLELTVMPEGEKGAAPVPMPFKKVESFLLIAEDDTISAAQLGDDSLLGATLVPGESLSTTLAFSVTSAAQLRFVCTPVKGSRPRSATWELD
jgi:hypothetical protein